MTPSQNTGGRHHPSSFTPKLRWAAGGHQIGVSRDAKIIIRILVVRRLNIGRSWGSSSFQGSRSDPTFACLTMQLRKPWLFEACSFRTKPSQSCRVCGDLHNQMTTGGGKPSLEV
jgi:hypothetical protein